MISRGIKKNEEIAITDEDYGAIYFSSGTTGFPKAILHRRRSLMHAAIVEQTHHSTKKDDVFLCIPPLYHTGAKMHWFGSLVSASKAILLKATAEVLKDGWLFTGDMAKQDKDGFYFLVDRKKDVIISGGGNLYPVQIEDFIRQYAPYTTWPSPGFPTSALARSPPQSPSGRKA